MHFQLSFLAYFLNEAFCQWFLLIFVLNPGKVCFVLVFCGSKCRPLLPLCANLTPVLSPLCPHLQLDLTFFQCTTLVLNQTSAVLDNSARHVWTRHTKDPHICLHRYELSNLFIAGQSRNKSSTMTMTVYHLVHYVCHSTSKILAISKTWFYHLRSDFITWKVTHLSAGDNRTASSLHLVSKPVCNLKGEQETQEQWHTN